MSKIAKKSDWIKAIVDAFSREDKGALGNLLRSDSISTPDAENLAYAYLDRWKKTVCSTDYSWSLYPPDALQILVRSRKLHRKCLDAIAKECFTIDEKTGRMYVSNQPLFLCIVSQRTCPKTLIDLTIDKCGITEPHDMILQNRSLTKAQYSRLLELYKGYILSCPDLDRYHNRIMPRLIYHKHAPIDATEQLAATAKYNINRLENLQFLTEVLISSRTPESFLLQYLKEGIGMRPWDRILLVFCNPSCTELVYEKIQNFIDANPSNFVSHVNCYWKESKDFRKHPRAKAIFQPLLFSSDPVARKLAKKVIDCEA